jgi:acetyl-CoA carboxylase carboxyl transferase subunit alpha
MSTRKPDPMQNALDFERPIVELEQKIQGLEELAEQTNMDLTAEVKPLRDLRDKLMKQIFSSLTPWQMVRLARHPPAPVDHGLRQPDVRGCRRAAR